ncbi:MAG: ClpXP protease specificity-enhancing factor [Gammaproteobacteria bacterium]
MNPQDRDLPSTRPYLIRAMHEWCTDHGFSPYMAVHVDRLVQVPPEYVNNGEIVLNVSLDATSGLKLGNDWIEFKARFGGAAREIMVPVSHVVAIYARENGQGMAFPPPQASDEPGEEPAEHAPSGPALRAVSPPPEQSPPGDDGGVPPGPKGPRPALKRVK